MVRAVGFEPTRAVRLSDLQSDATLQLRRTLKKKMLIKISNYMGKGDHSQRKEAKKPKKDNNKQDRKNQKKKSSR